MDKPKIHFEGVLSGKVVDTYTLHFENRLINYNQYFIISVVLTNLVVLVEVSLQSELSIAEAKYAPFFVLMAYHIFFNLIHKLQKSWGVMIYLCRMFYFHDLSLNY